MLLLPALLLPVLLLSVSPRRLRTTIVLGGSLVNGNAVCRHPGSVNSVNGVPPGTEGSKCFKTSSSPSVG